MRKLANLVLIAFLLTLMLVLALTSLASAGAALASSASVSGLVCLAGMLLPFAIAGAGLAGYMYAHMQLRRARQLQPPAIAGSALTRMPLMIPPTVFVVRSEHGTNASYPVPPYSGSTSQYANQAIRTPIPATPVLASIYGFGAAGSTEDSEDGT